MSTAWKPLRDALRDALKTDAGFHALAEDRYYIGYVPNDVVFPYAETPTAQVISTAWHTFGSPSNEDTLWPIFARCDLDNGGPAMVEQLLEAIDAALNNKVIPIAGYKVIMLKRVNSIPAYADPDDPTFYSGLLRYRIMLEVTS